jgi:hypothetical protein
MLLLIADEHGGDRLIGKLERSASNPASGPFLHKQHHDIVFRLSRDLSHVVAGFLNQ